MNAFRPHAGAQTRFLKWDGRYALFGGAAGGGKTDVLRFDPFRQIIIETQRQELPQDHPHYVPKGASRGRAIFFRRTMPELREVMDRCFRDFPMVAHGVNWNSNDKTFSFPCGYKYMFGQMEEEGDWKKYLGFEFTWAGFDELCTFVEEQFDWIDTRVRSTDPVLKDMLYVRAGSNPVGIGVDWVKRRFVDVAPPNTPVIRRVQVPKYTDAGEMAGYETVERRQIFIPAKVTDNKSIDAVEYAATLSSHSKTIRKQLLEGSWDHIHGAFLADEWDPPVHICKPFKIPRGWYKFRSCDYGYSAPASVSWWAVDTDGNMTCYRNITVKKHTAEMLAGLIKDTEEGAEDEWDTERGMSRLTGPLDFSCWATTGTIGPSIAETMMRMGVNWMKCTKDRHAGADQVRQRLTMRSGHPTIKDKDGNPALIVPGIRWFSTCTAPIKSLPALPADKNDPDVPDTDANDHNYDDTSYACMSRPLTPLKRDIPMDEIDELERRRAQRLAKTEGRRMGYPSMW